MPKSTQGIAALLVALPLAGCSGSDDSSSSSTTTTGSLPEPGPIEARALSFNVLCSFCDDSYDPWADRVGYIADVVQRHDPDLIGFQEFTTGDEVRQVTALVPGYDAVFLVDPEAPLFEEYADATALVRASKFEILETGFYFLSDHPDDFWSPGWSDVQFWRLVTWVHLRQRSDGREMFFATTHVDNNHPNQENSAPLILQRTEPWATAMPAVVVGDFNSRPDSEAYRILAQGATEGGFFLHDTFDAAPPFEQVHNQSPAPDYDPAVRIDHVFVSSTTPWSCSRWAVDQTVYGLSAKYPSDHFPIVAELKLE